MAALPPLAFALLAYGCGLLFAQPDFFITGHILLPVIVLALVVRDVETSLMFTVPVLLFGVWWLVT